MAFLLKLWVIFAKFEHNIGFGEKRNFFAKNGKNRSKL
jgi:hypothetical protein